MNFFSLVSKSAIALSLSMALGMVAGCDQSKEALDQTKDQLAKVTSERDQLKGQVDTMKVSMDAMKTESDANKAKMAEADAKLAACAPGAVPPPATPEKEHHAKAKTPGKAPPLTVAPKVDTTAPVGTNANPVRSRTGGL